MPANSRHLIGSFILLALLAGVTKALFFNSSLPPADFTFVNESEIKSLDPAIVTGSPENRIINAVFEGLTKLHPETLKPIPGLAKSWDISDDLLTYTFHMREEARWTDGSPVVATDIHYSMRRFLGPRTAAEYAYQAWYIKNAHNYSLGAKGIRAGDPVEVELNLPVDAINTWRGEIVHAKLLAVEQKSESDDQRVFVVEIDGKPVRYRPVDDEHAAENKPPANTRWCRQVLLDFREVGIEVIDPLTLRITLENPTPYFLNLMGFYPLFPVNQKCIETFGSPQWAKPENIVTNGPFNVEFRRIRDRIRLRKSGTYWNRDTIRLNVIDALSVDAVTTSLNMYMTDTADWVTEAPGPALRILRQQQPPRNDLNPAPFLSTYFYLLNTARKPLDDIRVRRALSLALDRKEITSKILAAGEVPALGFVPPGITGYESQQTAGYDPEEARRLLAEAGYPEGKGFPRLDILYNTHEMHQTIAEVIRKQWQRELGISISTRNEEWATYLASQRQMKYNISRRGWVGDYADPNTFLDMFVTDSEQNSTGWSNAEYDRLIAATGKEANPAVRMQLFQQAEKILLDELPILPIYFYTSKNMVKPYVRGFYNNVQDFHPLWAIWIDRESGETNEFMRTKGQP
ncbi:MAG: peptide ABC transporter substrate-binding protein [Planctomycetes bacterium]|nr:peptide ABC transporter substrate-binding protein [Planctomycetota bacterium]